MGREIRNMKIEPKQLAGARDRSPVTSCQGPKEQLSGIRAKDNLT